MLTTDKFLQRWLEATSDILDHVNNSVPLEALLNLIARTTCDLGLCDFSAIFTLDDEGSAFDLRGSAGLSADYQHELESSHAPSYGSTPEGESPTSRAFRFARIVAIPDLLTDPTCTPYQEIFRRQGVESILCLPLLTPQGPVGVLNCYWRHRQEFSSDLSVFMAAFANMAAMAVQTAILRFEERSTIARLNDANHLLEEQREALSRIDAGHRLMMDAALNKMSLEDLAASLQSLTNRLVSIDAVDSRLGVAGASRDSATSSPQLQLEVTVSGAVAATIVVTGGPAEVSELEARLFEQATVIAALILSGQMMALEASWRARRDILDDLLITPHRLAQAEITARARHLGIDLGRTNNLIVIKVRDAPSSNESRWLRRIEAAVTAHRENTFVHTFILGLVVVFCTAEPDARPIEYVAQQLVTELDDSTARLGGHVQVAISQDSAAISDYSVAFQAARRALDLKSSSSVIDVRRLGIFGVLLSSAEGGELAALASRVLAPLMQHGEGNDEYVLLDTVRTYLKHHSAVQPTAEALFVHPNTVRYRIRRAEELLGLSLADETGHLEVAFALAVAEAVSTG